MASANTPNTPSPDGTLCYTDTMLVIDPPQVKPIVPPLTPHNGMYRIGRTRVSLDSVIYAYRRGESAELIQDSFPTLSLPDIYTTIAWMLLGQQQISKTEMARRMETSRTAVDRLLDPNYDSATLATLERAALALGKRLQVALV